MTSRQKTFAVGMSRAMAPAARMLVYFLWQPEEVVSDVLSFFVNGTSQNLVRCSLMTDNQTKKKMDKKKNPNENKRMINTSLIA